MKRYILFILPLLLLFKTSISQTGNPPEILCLNVLDNGNVSVTWTYNTYLPFSVYNSIDGNNWELVLNNTIEVSSQQFNVTDTSANANINKYFYKVIVPTVNDTSNICATMYLNVDNSNPAQAYITWNNMSNPKPTGSDQYYNIYMSIYTNSTPGNWTLLADDIENPVYNYIVEDGLCYDSLNFMIEIGNTAGCTSVSNITGDWFSEDNQPETPVFDSVSIINNSQVILGWHASVSADVKGTYIYHETDVWTKFDSVTPYHVTYYIDSSYNPCDSSINYAIAAFDSCDIVSPGTYNAPQRPIMITNLESDLCTSSILINWTPYINPVEPLDKYQIWAVENFADTVLVEEVDGNTTFYEDQNKDQNTTYTYYIRAWFGNNSSTSCSKSITTSSYIVPEELYFINASVLENNTIDLALDIDINPVNCNWEIYRSDTNSTNMSLIKTFDRNAVTNPLYEYNDIDADGSTGYYYYNAIVYDSCGNESIVSNKLKTIYLTGDSPTENNISLSWNKFEGWDAGVEKYYIYRMTDGITPLIPFDSVNASTTQYNDDISGVSSSTTDFVYWISAKENQGNTYGYREISNSNRVTFIRETELYMPNAFRPDGLNNIFGPVVSGYAGTNYSMKIFNRWGQMIFESNSPGNGWNGTYSGKPSPAGLYIYHLSYINSKNEQKEYQGTVMLIR